MKPPGRMDMRTEYLVDKETPVRNYGLLVPIIRP
jgi:hypothetical protein